SPHAQSVYAGGWQRTASDQEFGSGGRNRQGRVGEGELGVADRWLDLQMYNGQPLRRELSGLGVEYRIVQLYSRDPGQREAKFLFNVGQGSQDIGFRNELDLLFRIEPAQEVVLRVVDENGEPTTGCFLVRDERGRVYPSPAKRLAPDFGFHPQVYRADGETMRLPAGKYQVECSRGPESLTQVQEREVRSATGKWAF